MNIIYVSDTLVKISYDDAELANELEKLAMFKKYKWAPEIVSIDGNHVYFKWNSHMDLDQHPSWTQQLFCILHDIHNMGYVKLNMDLNMCYFDDDGILHTLGMCSCVEVGAPVSYTDKWPDNQLEKIHTKFFK